MGHALNEKPGEDEEAREGPARPAKAAGRTPRTQQRYRPGPALQRRADADRPPADANADASWDATFAVLTGDITDESALPQPGDPTAIDLGGAKPTHAGVVIALSLHEAELEAENGADRLGLLDEVVELIIHVSNANQAARANFEGRHAEIAELIANTEKVDYVGGILTLASNITSVTSLFQTMVEKTKSISDLLAHLKSKPGDAVNAVKRPRDTYKAALAFKGKSAKLERTIVKMSTELQDHVVDLGDSLTSMTGLFARSEFIEFKYALQKCSLEIRRSASHLAIAGPEIPDARREQITAKLSRLSASIRALHARAVHVQTLALAIRRGGTEPMGRGRASRSLYNRLEEWVQHYPNNPAVRLVGKPTTRTVLLTSGLVADKGKKYIVAVERNSREQPWRLEIEGAHAAIFDDQAGEFHPGRVTSAGNPDTPNVSNRVIRLTSAEGRALSALGEQGMLVDHEYRMRYAINSSNNVVIEHTTRAQTEFEDFPDWPSESDLVERLCAQHPMGMMSDGIEFDGRHLPRNEVNGS